MVFKVGNIEVLQGEPGFAKPPRSERWAVKAKPTLSPSQKSAAGFSGDCGQIENWVLALGNAIWHGRKHCAQGCWPSYDTDRIYTAAWTIYPLGTGESIDYMLEVSTQAALWSLLSSESRSLFHRDWYAIIFKCFLSLLQVSSRDMGGNDTPIGTLEMSWSIWIINLMIMLNLGDNIKYM